MSRDVWNGAGRRIHLQEVGMRDGLQNEAAFVPTGEKIALVDALTQAGFGRIEVTACVSPAAVPALRDAEIVLRKITRREGTLYSALVPNVRGAERAIDARADELNLVMSVSETHNLCNLRMTRQQSAAALSEVIAFARPSATGINVSLSCAFGCPMEGDVATGEVMDLSARFLDQGVQGITLCDTTGMAHPRQVAQLVAGFRHRWPDAQLTLHFHNTRGMGLANVLAAIDAGADRFDTSFGGLGGCPYAPGATGNVCTEEVVHALQLMDYDTGIDLTSVLAAAARLPALIGHDIPSQIIKAGQQSDLHRPPSDLEKLRNYAAAKERRTITTRHPPLTSARVFGVSA